MQKGLNDYQEAGNRAIKCRGHVTESGLKHAPCCVGIMGFHGKQGFLQQASQTDEATLASSVGIWQDANCLKAKKL